MTRTMKDGWEVFFESWHSATAHLPRVSPTTEHLERSPAREAMDVARQRALVYGKSVLGWSQHEANFATGYMALRLLEWLRTDGRDRERLKQELQAAEERGRAEAALEVDARPRLEETLARQTELTFERDAKAS